MVSSEWLAELGLVAGELLLGYPPLPALEEAARELLALEEPGLEELLRVIAIVRTGTRVEQMATLLSKCPVPAIQAGNLRLLHREVVAFVLALESAAAAEARALAAKAPQLRALGTLCGRLALEIGPGRGGQGREEEEIAILAEAFGGSAVRRRSAMR